MATKEITFLIILTLLCVAKFYYDERILDAANENKTAQTPPSERGIANDSAGDDDDDDDDLKRIPVTAAEIKTNGIAAPKSNAPDHRDLAGTPKYSSEKLQSNRGNRMQPGTLQVAVYYDGAGSPSLSFHCDHPDMGMLPLTISDIQRSGQIGHEKEIALGEFTLGDCQLNPKVVVNGVQPDGAIDGIAFGIFFKDQEQRYCMYRSRAPQAERHSAFVGAWPLGFSSDTFTKQVNSELDGFGRNQLQTALMGAEFLSNGTYQLAICQYMERN